MTKIKNPISNSFSPRCLALALAVGAGLAAGSAQTVTTTQTFDLGTQLSPKTIQSGIGGLLPWIAKGALPPGSVLRSVSVNAIIENVGSDGATDDWASDICVYIDPSPEAPGTAALLQVGGYDKIGTVTQVRWANGDGEPRTPVNDTKTAAAWSILGDIDLSTVQLSVGNDWSPAAWSGTITIEYDVSVLQVTLKTPADTQAYPTGTSITATATVVDPNIALTHTVTFHTTPMAPAGPTVDTVSSATSSPFAAVLGVLPAGTYEVYATVINNDITPGTATSATHTFTVAAGISTIPTLSTSGSPSTYGQGTLTATVSPLPTGGTVQFYNGGSPLGSPVTVNTGTGMASYSINTLGAGTHEITAVYSGHGIYAAGTSDTLTQVVAKAPLTVKAFNVLRAPNTANPDPLPYLITGYQNGENLATSGITGTPSLTTDAVLSSPVGDYAITCAVGSLAAANYSFSTLVDGTLTVAVVANTFSVNFYVGPDWPYGGLTTDEQKANVKVPPGVPAGFADWYASGWLNFLVPWAPPAPQAPVTLTSTLGATATFTLKKCRNGWTYDRARTTLLGDGNGNMMDGHVNSTLEGANIFDMEVSDIPFAVYDVIFYMGANQAQYGNGTGIIVFNGGAEQGFTVQPGAFDGTFTEMVDAATQGNYIVFKGVTGTSFTTQTWGLGPNGFNHLGPFGFQIRDAAVTPPTLTITGITGPDQSGNFTITGTASASAKVGLFRSTAVNAPLASWIQDGGSHTGTAFNFTGTGGSTQAFFTLQVVP